MNSEQLTSYLSLYCNIKLPANHILTIRDEPNVPANNTS